VSALSLRQAFLVSSDRCLVSRTPLPLPLYGGDGIWLGSSERYFSVITQEKPTS